MLNVDRPQNPFTLTDEPDWKARIQPPVGSHAFRYDKLKSRNSHILSPTSDASHILPLDVDRDLLMNEVALHGPNFGSSSQSSVVSMSSNVARLAALPVPKKLDILSNPSYSQDSRNNEQGKKSTASRPLSGGRVTLGDGAETGFPPPPQRIVRTFLR